MSRGDDVEGEQEPGLRRDRKGVDSARCRTAHTRPLVSTAGCRGSTGRAGHAWTLRNTGTLSSLLNSPVTLKLLTRVKSSTERKNESEIKMFAGQQKL